MKKMCSKCDREKNLSKFYRDCKSPDGYRGTCKKCHNLVVKKWKEKHKDSVRRMRKEYNSRRGKIYPEKKAAWTLVWKAVKEGRLIKQPCACGYEEVQGHHEDYSKPLNVVWMCVPCHRKYHRRR